MCFSTDLISCASGLHKSSAVVRTNACVCVVEMCILVLVGTCAPGLV